ncbi:hypothetical protein, partial [Pseudomonas syringae]|uniref:hypothetical protein n=1 Tax=Pseudomonas syringae TaxID=317 RepID=UPI003204D76D
RNIPQTCLASTIFLHGREFCLFCISTHDASKGCIQPSGVIPLLMWARWESANFKKRLIVARSGGKSSCPIEGPGWLC